MNLYEPRQLADSMRVVRKNTIATAEDIPEAACSPRARSASSLFPRFSIWSRDSPAPANNTPRRFFRKHPPRQRETEMKTYPIVALFIALLLTGCAMGPNYQRPAVQTPLSFRAPEPSSAAQGESLADLQWFEVFK